MAKAFNPFEHHHDHHDCDHDHEHEREEMLDPAQRALSDALRVSFGLLKIIMCIMVVAYLFSNVFNVDSQHQAVRLRFGKIVERDAQTGNRIYESGGPYFAFPYPFEEVVRIPTSQRPISLNRQFWFEISDRDMGRTLDELAAEGASGPLNPEKDGSLLTGDANIVHARWSLSYRIDDPVAYITNIGDPQQADMIVRNAAEQAIVHAVARAQADEMISGRIEPIRQHAYRYIAQVLGDLDSGIVVDNLSATRTAMPMSVRDAYQAVLNAESERAQRIEAAQQEWSRVLGETAGEAYRPLWDLVQQYEQAAEIADTARIAELDRHLMQAFVDLQIDDLPIGGRVAEVVNEARTYRTQVVERVKTEARQFELLLPQYRTMPRIILTRQWEQARQAILTGDVESIYLPPGRTYLELSRDPSVQRAREQQRLQREQQERQQRR